MDNENEEHCADSGWEIIKPGDQCLGCNIEGLPGPCVVE